MASSSKKGPDALIVIKNKANGINGIKWQRGVISNEEFRKLGLELEHMVALDLPSTRSCSNTPLKNDGEHTFSSNIFSPRTLHKQFVSVVY